MWNIAYAAGAWLVLSVVFAVVLGKCIAVGMGTHPRAPYPASPLDRPSPPAGSAANRPATERRPIAVAPMAPQRRPDPAAERRIAMPAAQPAAARPRVTS